MSGLFTKPKMTLFDCGTCVEMCGLVTNTELNGLIGTVRGFDSETCRYKVQLSNGAVVRVKEGILHEQPIEESVERNAEASKTRKDQTEFDVTLSDMIFSQCNWVTTGEFSSSKSRFVGTINVGQCIAVFAWSPCRGFVAHIPIGAVLFGSRSQLREKRHVLQEVVDGLRETFPIGMVDVHLVGGHEATDDDRGLKVYFRKERRKHKFSYHVIDCVVEALGGRATLHKHLLNHFQGEVLDGTEQQQLRLFENGQRFIVCALDTMHGVVVTHTKPDCSGKKELCVGPIPTDGSVPLEHHFPAEGRFMKKK